MELNDEIERLVAGRWIAGATIDDAIATARSLNRRGMKAQINYLGELFTDEKEVADTMKVYERLLAAISRHKIMTDISVKPSQLGMLVDKDTLARNYTRIVRLSKQHKVFVWMDMEEDTYTDLEIRLYKTQLASGNTGICLQSYMKRSLKDAASLVRLHGTIRLVKGAYYTTKNRNYLDRPKATENYLRIMTYLFMHAKKFMVGTHDTELIMKALSLNKKYGKDVEYAMLNGINNKYAVNLAKSGENVSIYVPFGRRWIDYSYRRLKEASNLKLVIESLVKGD